MKDRIRQLMEMKHMNQQAFANYTGINNATLSNIFNGKTNPSLAHVYALRNKFPQLNLDWLVEGNGPMFNRQTNEVSPPPVSFSEAAKQPVPESDATQPSLFDNSNASSQRNVIQQAYGNTPSISGEPSPKPNNVSHAPHDNAIPRTTYYAERQRSVPTPQTPVQQSAKMSDEDNAQAGYSFRQTDSSPRMETVASLPQRKITEIRIFYDDQTWESFVPKKRDA